MKAVLFMAIIMLWCFAAIEIPYIIIEHIEKKEIERQRREKNENTGTN